MKLNNTHFPNLDAVRGFACLIVFVAHFFEYVNNRDLSAVEQWGYIHLIQGAGAMGVSLFFVLSGFLITYLLIREKEARKTIHVGFFYMKRILRIWPLFFLIVLITFFIFPLATGRYDGELTRQHLPWFLTFTINFDRILTNFFGIGNDCAGVLWSVAVEEQFYIVWPLIVLIFRKRSFPIVAILIVIGSALFRHVYKTDNDMLLYHTASVAGDLALGGLAAYYGFYSEAFRNFFRNRPTWFRASMLAGIVFVFANHYLLLHAPITAVAGRFILAFSFALLISDQCFGNPKQFSAGRIPFLSQIGNISYGIYCFHMFLVVGVLKFNLAMGYERLPALLFYLEMLSALLLTVGVSALSYRYFERPILNFRSRFDSMRDLNKG